MGFSVFPLTGNKTPRVRWGPYQHRRPTDREISKMFALEGVAGIGVVAGRVSGGDGHSLVVRDFDTLAGYQRWRDANPALARDAPTVFTRRGRHVYVRVPGFVRWRKLPAGELIGDSRHYACAPPTRHPSGVTYRWDPPPPLWRSDFPVVRLEDTGFVEVVAHRYRQEEKREEKTGGQQKKPTEPQNGLCATPHSLSSAALHDLPRALHEAVLRTLPQREGERNAKILYLARTLSDLVPATANAAELAPVVRQWWRMAKPVVGTPDWVTTWNDFRRAWSRVTTPVSASRPVRAMTEAAAACVTPDAKLLAVARRLARETGGTFHFSGRMASRVTGIPHRTAARRLRGMVEHGSLELVRQGTPGARTRRATEYRLRADA
jgi:hypothetical protein